MTARLIGPGTGILFVVVAIAAFAIGGETPSVDDPAREIISFYVDNDSDQQLASALLALAGAVFSFFLASLYRALRAAAGDEGGLPAAALVGGIMVVVGMSIFAGIGFTLGDAADELPADAVLALNALNSDLFFPLAVGTVVFNLALGLAVVRHGGFPQALGWFAILIAVAGLTPAGFFAFLATAIVVVWTSAALMMRAR